MHFSGHFPSQPGLASCLLILSSSNPYPEHPYRTGQNSSYPRGALGCTPPNSINRHLSGLWKDWLWI